VANLSNAESRWLMSVGIVAGSDRAGLLLSVLLARVVPPWGTLP
jgi:hypothetical protein